MPLETITNEKSMWPSGQGADPLLRKEVEKLLKTYSKKKGEI